MLQTQYSNPVQHIPQPKRSLVKSFAIRFTRTIAIPGSIAKDKIFPGKTCYLMNKTLKSSNVNQNLNKQPLQAQTRNEWKVPKSWKNYLF
ncbi:hypothetical protein [Microcoleus sp.]|uniref:hypothetical protein n=1 Tax=Microcoleus sp. TaxID=44472 RepID=UPI0035948211